MRRDRFRLLGLSCRFSRAVLVFLLLIAACWGGVCAELLARHPNIVIVLADDMGWGDPGCYNEQSKIPTPGIDRLAREGMRFTDAHTPSSVCTPTRYGLLVGRYAWRTRLKSGVLDGFSPPLIESDRTTLASFLKDQGYATACIGKWHLGMQWTRRDGSPETADRAPGGFRDGGDIDFSRPVSAGPRTVGFDHFFGISASLDMPPYCFIRNDRCEQPPTTRVPTAKDTIFLNQSGGAAAPGFRLDEVLPRFKHEAQQWIRQHCADHPEQPFFLYVALNSPHLPVAPSESFAGTSQAGTYGDFVAETDDCVAGILQTLIELNQDRETCFVFTSDNGGLWHAWDPVEADDLAAYQPTPRGLYTAGFGHRSNAHWRGTKADIWEGGHRVPLIVRYPDRVAAGQTCDQLVELTDWLATVSGLIDVPLPAGAASDSKDFTSLLDGGEQPVREFAIHHSVRGHFAIRSGPWKLIQKRGSGGFSMPRLIEPTEAEPRGQLYNLVDDPSETKNLWASQSGQVEKLSQLLQDTVDPLDRQRIRFQSTADGTEQEAILIAPQEKPGEPVPVVVNLHSWSADLNQRSALERLVHDRGWYYLFPNFRGVNQTPQACGSPLAQQDVLDAVDWLLAHHQVDRQRVYLTGASGGGHMTMLMAGRYPDRWRAASAWVGISDLVSWHEKHRGSRYGNMMELCCGGAPGDSDEVDRQYRLRSPIHVIEGAKGLPIDLLAGADDGHTGSVPIVHSINAFNKIAQANGTPPVSEEEIQQLARQGGRLLEPTDGDVGFDPALDRDYFLRRHSGTARLTIFDGGHESIAEAILDWFEQHP